MSRETVFEIIASTKMPLSTGELKEHLEQQLDEEINLSAVWQQCGELLKEGRITKSKVGRAAVWSPVKAGKTAEKPRGRRRAVA